MKLYEEPRGSLPQNQRVYTRTFARSTTRYVSWELNLKHPDPGVRKNFRIEAVYYTGDGSILAKQTKDTYIDPGWTTSYHSFGWGSADPGHWTPGSYRLVLSVDGREVAWQIFTVVDH